MGIRVVMVQRVGSNNCERSSRTASRADYRCQSPSYELLKEAMGSNIIQYAGQTRESTIKTLLVDNSTMCRSSCSKHVQRPSSPPHLYQSILTDC